jgi:hypothetical protein
MISVLLSHYTIPDGPRVHDVLIGGAASGLNPSEDEARARAYADGLVDGFRRDGKRVSFGEWDGDLGVYIAEPQEVRS